MQQLVERGALEALVFALRLYMDCDECVCNPPECPQNCEACMFCMARSALGRIDEEA